MYTTFLAIARRIFGSGLGKHLLWIVPVLTAVSFIMLCIPAWRKRERAAWRGELPRLGLLTLFFSAVFRLVLVVTLVGGLAAALLVQRGLFSEKHGCVTQRNYEAVKSKWGVPHEQRDLRVTHYVMRTVVQEGLSDGSSRERMLEERQPAAGEEERIVLSEEVIPAPPGEEERAPRPPRVVRRVTARVRQTVAQDSIETAEAEISLRSNARRLGNAAYAGYDDKWQMTYGVRNRSEYATQALFHFPLPAEGYGVFDRLSVKVDDQEWLPNVRYRGGNLEWRMTMSPGEAHKVGIGYTSRGLEYFRYKPGNMRERCLVTVRVEGIEARRLNFPIGSMPPRDDLKSLSGQTYSLHWDLSRAVSNLDIGIVVPTEEQPGYHITRLLGAAPMGLALLALMLFLTRWLISGRIDLLPVCLVLVAFYIGNALLANLNDILSPFALAFAASLLPLVAAVSLFWRKMDGARFLGWQSSLLYGLFTIVYPLAALSEEAGGTTLHVIYTALVFYVLSLVAWNATRRSSPPSAA